MSSSRPLRTAEVRREGFYAAVALHDAPLDVRHHRSAAFGPVVVFEQPPQAAELAPGDFVDRLRVPSGRSARVRTARAKVPRRVSRSARHRRLLAGPRSGPRSYDGSLDLLPALSNSP